MWSSPFITQPTSVSQIMLRVLLALVPGIALYVWYFGPAILVSIALASLTALAVEAVMLKLRNRPIKPFLSDNSALLTAWLLALSIPPLAPWWLVVVGTAFAIAIPNTCTAAWAITRSIRRWSVTPFSSFPFRRT